MLEDWICAPQHWARAVRSIADTPGYPAARRGDVGEVCDVDVCDGYVFVDFGAGAMPCEPDEILPAAAPRT